jgi:DNA-binding transcriptional regulator YhcF (GntR family)
MSSRLLTISRDLSKPKFEQIIDGITGAIRKKKLKRGDLLPSVNQMCKDWSLARATVVKAYEHLKQRGIIESEPCKGYFIATESVEHTAKVFLLLDSFDLYMQVLFNSFIQTLGNQAVVDVFFSHCNFKVFETLVLDNAGKYDFYVVKSFNDPRVRKVIDNLDRDKVLIIDRLEHFDQTYSYAVQDFCQSSLGCLEQLKESIKKYNCATLIQSKPDILPAGVFNTFQTFCEKHGIKHKAVNSAKDCRVSKGDWYLIIEDYDLVQIVKQCNQQGLILGKDVGIISYNDTPMKEISANGITVLSVDWNELGRMAADFILNPKATQTVLETKLVLRNSM